MVGLNCSYPLKYNLRGIQVRLRNVAHNATLNSSQGHQRQVFQNPMCPEDFRHLNLYIQGPWVSTGLWQRKILDHDQQECYKMRTCRLPLCFLPGLHSWAAVESGAPQPLGSHPGSSRARTEGTPGGPDGDQRRDADRNMRCFLSDKTQGSGQYFGNYKFWMDCILYSFLSSRVCPSWKVRSFCEATLLSCWELRGVLVV